MAVAFAAGRLPLVGHRASLLRAGGCYAQLFNAACPSSAADAETGAMPAVSDLVPAAATARLGLPGDGDSRGTVVTRHPSVISAVLAADPTYPTGRRPGHSGGTNALELSARRGYDLGLTGTTGAEWLRRRRAVAAVLGGTDESRRFWAGIQRSASRLPKVLRSLSGRDFRLRPKGLTLRQIFAMYAVDNLVHALVGADSACIEATQVSLMGNDKHRNIMSRPQAMQLVRALELLPRHGHFVEVGIPRAIHPLVPLAGRVPYGPLHDYSMAVEVVREAVAAVIRPHVERLKLQREWPELILRDGDASVIAGMLPSAVSGNAHKPLIPFLMDKVNAGELTEGDVYGLVVDLFIEGVEPTAAALEFYTYAVAQSPVHTALVRAEVRALGPRNQFDGFPDIDAKAEVPWTRACALEALRLMPPVPTIARTLDADVIVRADGSSATGDCCDSAAADGSDDVALGDGGVFIPAGERVLLDVAGANRLMSPEFDPARFVPGEALLRQEGLLRGDFDWQPPAPPAEDGGERPVVDVASGEEEDRSAPEATEGSGCPFATKAAADAASSGEATTKTGKELLAEAAEASEALGFAFGGGRRTCPALGLAEMQMVAAALAISRELDVSFDGDLVGTTQIGETRMVPAEEISQCFLFEPRKDV